MDDLYIEDDGENLREVRGTSAYSTLRFLIEILLVVGIVAGIVGAAWYLSMLRPLIHGFPLLAVIVVFITAMNILVAFVVRGLALALLDIADAQLQQVGRNGRREL